MRRAMLTTDAHNKKIIAQRAWYVNQNDARAKLSFVRTRIGSRGAHPLIPILHPGGHNRAPT